MMTNLQAIKVVIYNLNGKYIRLEYRMPRNSLETSYMK